MKRFGFPIVVCLAALAGADASLAQTDADRVLSGVRRQIVALRVWGPKAQDPRWPKNEPPIWGTGFIVGPLGTNITGRQRIITAGHVVQTDDMWERRGGVPARSVYPTVYDELGRTEMQPYHGVALHGTRDIAQVAGPRDATPIPVLPSPLTADTRYFVVSWEFDDLWGGPAEEPRAKEVKLVQPAPNDPPLEKGLALVEILPGQPRSSFQPSESGSPVLDINGAAVGIMIQARVDATTGQATRGVALPFAAVADWLNGVRTNPVAELKIKTITAIAGLSERRNYLSSITGACVFLGKYSARQVVPGSDKALADAPAGVPLLKRVIDMFPQAAPDLVPDTEATLEARFAEPQPLSIAPGGAINIRSHCPNVVAKPRRQKTSERIAYYGSILARADNRVRIIVQNVQRQAYLEDFFYWGVIESAVETAQ